MGRLSSLPLANLASGRAVAIVLACVLGLFVAACGRRPAAAPGAPYPVVPTPPAAASRTPFLTVGPTSTRPPKPTVTVAPVPLPSATPTPLTLPPSIYQALWVENAPASSTKKAAVFWRADPANVGARQRVLALDGVDVISAVLAPNGLQLAIVTSSWETSAHPLWLANSDGSGLRQVATSAGQPAWSVDGTSIVYAFGEG